MAALKKGQLNSLADVAGLRVGHAGRVGEGWRTGVTVVLPPSEGAVCGVDVRGAAPGTRETDLLDPRNLVERVHAVVLAGGSAYGLAAATGVMEGLAGDGIGFPVAPGVVVPIVPGAVIFDLSRGGLPRATPGPDLGAQAYEAARAGRDNLTQGSVGAGTGAIVGGLAGGIGMASLVLPTGSALSTEVTVAALAVVNAAGSPVDLETGRLYAAAYGLPGEFPDLGTPHPERLAAWREKAATPASFNTVIGVVATDATLTKGQCARLATAAHDGLARAIRPAHTMSDGDTIFGMATGEKPAPDVPGLSLLLDAAAGCFARAIGHAMYTASGSAAAPSYREMFSGTAN